MVISFQLLWVISRSLIIVAQSLNLVHLFATPWTAVCQASLSFIISWSLLKLMSIELVMPSSHFIHCDIEWFALETNRDHSVVFEVASKYCISDSLVDHDGYSISSKGFLPTVVDIMVI